MTTSPLVWRPLQATPGLFGRTTTVEVSYSDTPAVPLMWRETACNRPVWLKSSTHSLEFRAGLVARNTRNPAQMVQLASTASTYGYSWELTVHHPGQSMDNTLLVSRLKSAAALSPSAPALKLDGTLANDDINARMEEEKNELRTRCRSVLDTPRLPLP